MKKIHFHIFVGLIAILGILTACHENIIDETLVQSEDGTEFKYVQITNQIDIKDLPEHIQFGDLKILSLSGEEGINSDGASKIMTYEGYLPQVLMLTDSNNELLLMTRSDFHEGEKNEMSIRSTAIALVTMHPALSGVKSHVYQELVRLITESSAFNELEEAISDAVLNGRSFVDPDSATLITALNKVFEQVVATTEENTSDGELPNEGLGTEIYYSTYTRASELKGVTTIAGINVGPFHVTTSGASVVVENYSLTPLYSGLVTHHGYADEFDIPSGDDRGITFFFDKSWGSTKVEYPFHQEGEYQFYFDKTTAESYFDQAKHTICNVIEVIGLPLGKGMLYELSEDIMVFMIEHDINIIGLISGSITPPTSWEIVELVCDGFASYIKEGHLEKFLLKIGSKQAAAQMAQAVFGKVCAVYSVYEKCRGAINAIMRITMRLESQDNVAFGLYYYQGEITTATRASLEIYSGNNQDGLVGRRLNEPVCVKVTTIGSDGSQVAASNFHRVKFETDIRNGITLDDVVATDPDGYAQTFWTLDSDNTETQYLKATVIDIVTGEDISDAVIFSATPTDAANVAFTLEWSPTDSNCDIDLHIIDPYDHHIYYGDMFCECGAYLDRDDRHGPGPEHIYYTQAKPGKYLVYVHHYESDSQGSVGFKVTTEYDERRFVNRSSVQYGEMAYVGTLEVVNRLNASGNRSITSKPSVRFYYDDNAPAYSTDTFPQKQK